MIRPWQIEDQQALVGLIAEFRATMTRFRGWASAPDLRAAEQEIASYEILDYQVFVASTDEGEIIGYITCHFEDGKLWAESLFVRPEYRRQGIGSALYNALEAYANVKGEETILNRVHPNNERMINFLRKNGYDVLNMIEIRKSRSDENDLPQIKLGLDTFHYCC